jgi:integrase
MGHRKDGIRADPDRYLVMRGGVFYYRRRVPGEVRHLDTRGESVRHSLKTSDLAQARAMRDVLEAADAELWSSLLQDKPREAAAARYQSAVRRAQALGFSYRPTAELVTSASTEEVLRRIEAAISAPALHIVPPAVLGSVDEPKTTLREAMKMFLAEIAPHEIASKSPAQRKKWTDTKSASVDAFVDEVGDLPIDDITRDHARKFYDHFMRRIAPPSGLPTCSASLGNRRIGDMRALFRSYFAHLGEPDRKNPFDGLGFKDKSRRARKRPSLPAEWIVKKMLAPGALARLNDEARGILLVVAETGARPSEIANLTAPMIVLKHKVPHLRIEPRFDPNDPREIKTESSIRVVPLVGLAFEVMKRHPGGFTRYKDREARLSATLNKYLKENKLFPSEWHTVYSLRHSFEDRMKEARIDTELRKILMGHALDRPEYGEGGSLALRREAMVKVALPFDPSIV